MRGGKEVAEKWLAIMGLSVCDGGCSSQRGSEGGGGDRRSKGKVRVDRYHLKGISQELMANDKGDNSKNTGYNRGERGKRWCSS